MVRDQMDSPSQPSRMNRSFKVGLARLQQVGRDFLITELDLGITFADMALGSDDSAKARRNRGQARAAYRALERHFGKVTLIAQDARLVKSKLRRLKSKLRRLGEKL
jgi:hypothetical protein